MPSVTDDVNSKNGVSSRSDSALCSVEEFVSQSHDYVIIGGGTAGLCLAARLTEDPDISVGVLEAGKNRLDDKSVLTPSLFPTLPGRSDYDWMMESIPQVCSLSRPPIYTGGSVHCALRDYIVL
jgi:hypothetical protein